MELADFIRVGRQEPALRFLIIGGLDLRLPHYEELFLKYGTREIYDTILRLLRNP